MEQRQTVFINYFIVIVFAILSIVGLAHHTIWLDEANCWLMIKSSHSIKELFQYNHYQGYLSLWEFCLYILSRFTDNMLYVQLFNMLISVVTAYLFLRYFPFSILQKICILFSYFFLFEYAILSRSYALTWLFLVTFCILFTRKRHNYPAIVLVLILLANTHFLSLVISIPLFFITIYFMRNRDRLESGRIILVGLLFTTGVAIALFNMMPPGNATALQFRDSYFSSDHISKALSFFVKGLYPLPDFGSTHFWNSNFIIVHFKVVSILLTAIILIVPYIMFYNKPAILLFFYAANLAVASSLFALQLVVGVRYMGYCFMILIVSLWLASDQRFIGKLYPIHPRLRISTVANKWMSKSFLWSIFFVQLLSGISVFYTSLCVPFSEAKNTADYIKTNLPLHTKVIVYPTPSGPSISAYLNRSIYYPQTGTYGTFYQWTAPLHNTAKELTQQIYTDLYRDSSRYAAVVIALETDSAATIRECIELAVDTGNCNIFKQVVLDKSLVKSENYIVYLLRKK